MVEKNKELYHYGDQMEKDQVQIQQEYQKLEDQFIASQEEKRRSLEAVEILQDTVKDFEMTIRRLYEELEVKEQQMEELLNKNQALLSKVERQKNFSNQMQSNQNEVSELKKYCDDKDKIISDLDEEYYSLKVSYELEQKRNNQQFIEIKKLNDQRLMLVSQLSEVKTYMEEKDLYITQIEEKTKFLEDKLETQQMISKKKYVGKTKEIISNNPLAQIQRQIQQKQRRSTQFSVGMEVELFTETDKDQQSSLINHRKKSSYLVNNNNITKQSYYN